MKKLIFALVLLLSGNLLIAQDTSFNVVFDVTSKDTAVHQTVTRWVNGILKSYPDAKVEIVFYGKSLDMVTKDKSIVESEVAKLAATKNVYFSVCEIALKRQNIEKSSLIAGVQTVPDGIYQLVRRQKEGWGYIKATP